MRKWIPGGRYTQAIDPFGHSHRQELLVDVDSLNALSAFMHAAEMRSFTEAGKHLNLSSSAIGKAVARLEERHGVRLFNRNTRTMTLTQAGQLFLDSCKTIFSEIEKLA